MVMLEGIGGWTETAKGSETPWDRPAEDFSPLPGLTLPLLLPQGTHKSQLWLNPAPKASCHPGRVKVQADDATGTSASQPHRVFMQLVLSSQLGMRHPNRLPPAPQRCRHPGMCPVTSEQTPAAPAHVPCVKQALARQTSPF